jgi:hypothetical protein
MTPDGFQPRAKVRLLPNAGTILGADGKQLGTLPAVLKIEE